MAGLLSSTQGGLENVGVGGAGEQVPDYQIQETGRRNLLLPDWRPRLAEQVNRGKQTTFLDEERNVVKSLPS